MIGVCYYKFFNFDTLSSYRYRWTKNGKKFEWQTYDERMSNQPGRGTLVITKPRDEDLGKYFIGIKL